MIAAEAKWLLAPTAKEAGVVTPVEVEAIQRILHM